MKYRVEQGFIFLIIAITLTSIVYSIASFWSQPNNVIMFTNHDIMQDLYVAHNLIYEQGSLYHWYLSQAPYYFPDITFFYLSEHILKNTSSNLPLFALFQIIVLFFALFAIFRIVTKTKLGVRVGILSALFYLFMITVRHQFQVYGNSEAFTTILVPSFHYGGALIVFLCLALFLNVLRKPNFYFSIILGALLILSGISDPLVLLYFSVPTVLALTVLYYLELMKKGRYWKLTFFISLISVSSYLIYSYLPFPIHKEKLIISFKFIYIYGVLKSIFTYFIKHHLIFGLMWLTFVIAAPISLIKSHKADKTTYSLIDYTILYLLLIIITAFPFFCLTMASQYQWLANSHTMLPLSNRYLIPFFLGPCLIGFPLLLYKHKPKINILLQNAVYLNLLLVLSVIALLIRPNLYSNNLLNYNPKLVACVDHNAKKYGLQNGIGMNLFAQTVTDYDRHGIHIAYSYLSNNGFTPNFWLVTSQNSQRHNYNFVMTDSQKEVNMVTALYGRPSHEFECGQMGYPPNKQLFRFKFLVYKNGELNHVFNSYIRNHKSKFS